MFSLSESLPDEGWCAKVLRNVRWNSFAVCPHCNSLQVKKDGYYRSYQKYFCKECKRWFNDKTGTIFHYSHTPLKAWFLALYLFFVLWPGCSIHETSLEVRVSYYRCYKFIRSVMKRLTSSSSSYSALGSVKLGGIVEADEFYIKAGLKGRPYHLEILNSGRLPRHRGLKPWRGRGTYEKEYPMITCIHQRRGVGGGMTYFDVRTKQSLISNICRSVHRHCKVYTDEYLGYRKLKEYGFVHKQVCHSQKEYARGVVHVNNCECRSNLYKIWIRKFMGVNKHNLQSYTKTFQFIHNNRSNTDNRKERFMKVLGYN
jgi:transposase-like protein